VTTREITWTSIGVNTGLAGVKIGFGLLARSQTLLADGLHSVSDLVTDGAVLAGLHISSRPADDSHHYGHGRVTTLVTMFVGAALLATAIWIVYNAVATYGQPDLRPPGAGPFWIALLSIVPKELLYRVTRTIGIRAGDASVVANAWHHRTDAFTSVAAAAGLAGVAFGGSEFAFLDHLTAVVLSAFLAIAALRFIGESVSEMIDAAPGGTTVRDIEKAISATPGVRRFHDLRVRKVAGSLMLDVHIHVDPDLSVVEGHDIATEVRNRLLDCGCSVLEAMVHVEPAIED
jgi:cation diffusion facilitator family transporter